MTKRSGLAQVITACAALVVASKAQAPKEEPKSAQRLVGSMQNLLKGCRRSRRPGQAAVRRPGSEGQRRRG
jgi:hypothetical protein